MAKSGLLKSVLVLMSGTLFAQILTFLLSPVFARLYSESDFGDFTIYARYCSFLSVLATLRYEIAIPIPNKEFLGRRLFLLSFRIAVIFTALLFAGVLVTRVLNTHLNTSYWIITVLSVFMIAYIAIGSNWIIRTKRFKTLTASKISSSVFGNGFRIVFGFFGWGGFGLIFSSLLGYFANALFFVKDHLNIRKYKEDDDKRISTKELVSQFKEYPIVGLPHALLDTFRDILVASFLVKFFGKDLFGSYGFAIMLLGAPLVVLGQSYAQVMTRSLAEAVDNFALLYQRTKKVILISLLSIFPFGILFFFSEELFVLIFSEKWRNAGIFAEILSLNFFLTFLNAPISSLPLILKKQTQFFFIGLLSTFNIVVMFCILPNFVSHDFYGFTFVLSWYSYVQTGILCIPILYLLLYIKNKRNSNA